MSKILELAHKVSPFTVCGEGNVSSRYFDKFYIKSSGEDLSKLTLDGITLCDLDGNKVFEHHKKQSIETLFHSWIYKNFSEINYISHTHPINTVKILCSSKIDLFSERRLFPDQIVRNGHKSCVVPYSCPGKDLVDSLEKSVNKFVDREGFFPKLILLQNHGIITTGSGIEECITSTYVCEKSAEIFIGSIQLGEIHFLSLEQVNKINECPEENYRKKVGL